MKNKIGEFETNLHYGHKYFEETLDEKEQIIREKSEEIDRLKEDLAKKYENDLVTHQSSLLQFVSSLKSELNEKIYEIEQMKTKYSS